MSRGSHTPFAFHGADFDRVDLLSLARELLASDAARKRGRTSRTLAKANHMTTVLCVIVAGGEIREHAAPGPLSVIPMIGKPVFHATEHGGSQTTVEPGQVLHIRPGHRHRVTAREDCAFLLVIGPG
jgi:quercetin dioxygenase-like cupin family protein